MNAIRPDLLMPSERLAEIAEILAAGLMRLEARKSSELPAHCGESSLHFSPEQSGRGTSPMKALEAP